MQRTIRLLGVFLAGVTMWIEASPVLANCSTWTAVSSCPATCNTNCRLTADLNCTNGNGITLNGGVNIDLCGFDINCPSVACTSKPAITMAANGSQVVNNGASQSVINSFDLAVDCSHTGSIIDGIFFENNNYSTQDCSKVFNNVFNNSQAAKYTGATGLNTDEFTDNDLNSIGSMIAISNRSTSLKIEHNLFQMGASSTKGVVLTNSSNITVQKNVFLGHGTPVEVTSSSLTTDANYCDPNDPADPNDNFCRDCRTAGYCETPGTPFLFP